MLESSELDSLVELLRSPRFWLAFFRTEGSDSGLLEEDLARTLPFDPRLASVSLLDEDLLRGFLLVERFRGACCLLFVLDRLLVLEGRLGDGSSFEDESLRVRRLERERRV